MFAKKFLASIFALVLLFVPALSGCTSFSASPDIQPHLIDDADPEPVRPIDSSESVSLSAATLPLTDEQYRDRVDELYRIVAEDGKKPQFIENDPVKPIYDAAVELMNRYIRNSWHTEAGGEEKKVHSIHDYLVYYIEYDTELYENYRHGQDVSDNPAFDIDGVLINRLAVCDGLSRAFVFLCAIEGIDAIRVTGSYIGVPHAWNKVKVDGDWYNVDITADSASYVIDGNDRRHQLSHGYFLLSDGKFKSFRPRLHVFESTVQCLKDYDYFRNKTVSIGGKSFPCVVTSQATLNSIFEAIADSDRAVGKIELKLEFEGKINVNDADMYVSEINTAYTRVFDADFTTASQRPYFQSPDGVYLFLIYK